MQRQKSEAAHGPMSSQGVMEDGFASFGLAGELERAIRDMGFEQPTRVQSAAVPAALVGRDVLACASTGSGKTAAFLLPLMQRLLQDHRRGTRALVIVPTRELAAQVAEHFTQLARHTRLRCAAVYGGVGMRPQEDAFRSRVDMVVATPGRLLDHMQHDYARMPDLDALVLDEADRMLDMGFLPDIRRVLRQLPARPRQTMLFSATMPAPIVTLSRELLREPARIDVERRAEPAKAIEQALYTVPASLKVELLLELLRRGTVGNAIIFCRTKHRANRVAERLTKRGIAAARMHGNRSQAQRTDALEGFRSGRYRVLVATDIVARGIDVEALEHVINFDVPAAPADYIHRVGRTGRANATGDAYTLVAPEDEDDVRAIEKAIGRRIERRTLAGFDYAARVEEKLEIPLAERLAAMRADRAAARARAAEKAELKQASSEQAVSREAPRARNGASTSTGGEPLPGKNDDGRRRRRRRNRGNGHGAHRNDAKRRDGPTERRTA